MSDLIDKAFDQSVALLEAENEDIEKLSNEVATFLRIYSAQGVIDNGGYIYFFENDWPGNPPYSEFINSYTNIGCIEQANELRKVVATFPFENPHMEKVKRIIFMEKNENKDEGILEMWGDELCGDKEVWGKLEQYYVKHKRKFA